MARFTFVYDGYASLNGTPDHLVPKLDPTNLLDAPHGLSGTEVHMLGTALELCRRGYEVDVFAAWTPESTGEMVEPFPVPGSPRLNGVMPIPISSAGFISRQGPPAAIVAYHDGRPLARWPDSVSKFAHHQSYGLSPAEDATNHARAYFTATERVARYHRERRGWDISVVPNAWDYGRFLAHQPVPGRILYATGFERGFHRLMEAFSRILALCPKAHVVAFERGGPEGSRRARELAAPFGEAVTILPASSRNTVLRELSMASVYAYPCDVPSPTEVWPVSVTDACAAGVPVVLAPDDGLEELFVGGPWLTPGVKTSPDHWLGEFARAVGTVLTNPTQAERVGADCRAWAAPHTFARSVDVFLAELARHGVDVSI